MKSKTYDEFVEKFKPKKTTDDCYTPERVYDAVKDWCITEYQLENTKIVRPFYPGGDYENYNYENAVVIDNPPFSIITKIANFYMENGIKFFLFAPHLTLFAPCISSDCSCVVVDCLIEYHNGAKVKTSFITNMEENAIRTAPELKRMLEITQAQEKTELPKYTYPDCVISSARLGKITTIDIKIPKNEAKFVRSLDSQKEKGKAIFGTGAFVSANKAAEIKAAEIKAAEIKAAEIKAAEIKAAEIKAAEIKAAVESIEWQLSNNEQHIIDKLDNTSKELRT